MKPVMYMLCTLLLTLGSEMFGQSTVNQFCPAATNPPCDDEECKCSTPDTPSTLINDPVDIANGNTYLRVKDISISGSVDSLDFVRTYNSHDEAWWYLSELGTEVPKPFGASPTDRTSLKWWHNFYSLVYTEGWAPPPGSQGSGSWRVRDTNGNQILFIACATGPQSTPCLARPNDGNRGVQDRLYFTGSVLQSKPFGEFVLQSGYRRYVYGAYWAPLVGSFPNFPNRYFLTRIESVVEKGNGPLVLADITYAMPAGLNCAPGGGYSTTGVPYIKSITSADGAALNFNYKELKRPDRPMECVISSVSIEDHKSAGTVVSIPVVDYAYELDQNGVQLPGRLRKASWPATSRTEEYAYQFNLTQFVPPIDTFKQTQAGYDVAYHVYDHATTRLRTSSAAGQYLRIDWPLVSPVCPPAPTSCQSPEQRIVYDQNATIGDGSDSASVFTQKYVAVPAVGLFHGPRLFQITDICDLLSSNSACAEVSQGSKRWEWTPDLGLNNPSVLKAIKDKRDNWTAFKYRTETALTMPMAGKISTMKGAKDPDGTGALETENYNYTYMANIGSVYSQYPYRSERPSLLAPAGSIEPVSRTEYNWHLQYHVLLATFRSGWTREINPANGTATIAKKYIATFNLPSFLDPLFRTLEIHGPCWVADEKAQDCPVGTLYPVTKYSYWPLTEVSNRRNRLQAIAVFPHGAGGISLQTTYDEYDAYGNPTKITDPNNIVSTLTYEENRVKTRTVGNALTTYTYDNARLSRIQFPEGNYEIFCYREGTSGAACTGGTWSPRMQWRAKSGVADGSTWSEKVQFTYWRNGTLKQETYLGGCTVACTPTSGDLRHTSKYATDAQRRPTWEGWGDGPFSVRGAAYWPAARGYDAADNLSAIGLPYNHPEPWCGGATASKRCSVLQYDPANRLQSIVQYPTATSASGSKTCFEYDDKHGNVSVMKTGCGSGNEAATKYVYDDFDNLVQVILPSGLGAPASPPEIWYEYDAAGMVAKKQTQAERSSSPREWEEFSYDQLGRITIARKHWGGNIPGNEVLYTLDYDHDGGLLAPTCGETSNTLGRLRKRTDSQSVGITWYQYDAEGRVLKEIRDRGQTGSCPLPHSDLYPHTEYTYTSNGNLASIIYPHGRVVRYLYYNTNGMNDRVREIQVDTSDGVHGTRRPILTDARWEPYGGLGAYTVIAPLPLAPSDRMAAVEYLRTGDANPIPTLNCATSRPSGSDHSGRIRGLWISRSALADPESSRLGQIFKQTYTWKENQITVRDTCLLANGITDIPRREQYDGPGYDQLLQLKNATRPAGNFAKTGGSFNVRTYDYDVLGNRISEQNDACTTTLYQYQTGYFNQLKSRSSGCGLVDRAFDVDTDGRVTSIKWINAKTKHLINTTTLAYRLNAQLGGGPDVFRAAVIGANRRYTYFYDSDNHRRMKRYPTGAHDDYFYDLSSQLIEDRGAYAATLSAPMPIDEYIWLDGRPIAFVRSRFNAAWQRQSDLNGDCQRNGEPTPCGIYFIVTDQAGKPVVLLDSNRRVAGAADYDPFGYPNRVTLYGHAHLPYAPASTHRLAALRQTPGPNATVRLRAKFDLVNTNCLGQSIGYGFFSDSSGASLGVQVTGTQPMWSDWVTVPANGRVDIGFQSPNSSVPCPASNYGDLGVSVEGYEYQRYEVGASPVWLPLRFPGQYYDAETDLVNNWNRYYDPSIGRYLQPEPLIYGPGFGTAAIGHSLTFRSSTDALQQLLANPPSKVLAYASAGRQLLPYAFVGNNPIRYIDPTGADLTTWDAYCSRHPEDEACTGPKKMPLDTEPPAQPETIPTTEQPRPLPRNIPPPGPGGPCHAAFLLCTRPCNWCSSKWIRTPCIGMCVAAYLACRSTGF